MSIDVLDEVRWQGRSAKVVALTVEPSAVIEFSTGDRLCVGLSVLSKVPDGEQSKA